MGFVEGYNRADSFTYILDDDPATLDEAQPKPRFGELF